MATKSGENLLFKKESYTIRGVCFQLYQQFGGAFKESIIDKALISELRSKGLKVEDQKRINIMYRGEKLGTYVPDVIVEDKILLELKVKPKLTKTDERQFWYYLRGSNYKLGFLINFGSNKLEIKRRIYDKARNSILIRVNPRVNPRLSASTDKGFTLIEMLVAVSLFALIVGSATGLFIAAIRSQANALASQKLLDETSYVMEYMSRSLRMAKKNLTSGCIIGGGPEDNYGAIELVGVEYLMFKDYQERCMSFQRDTQRLGQRINWGTPTDLTSTDFDVTSLKWNLSGESQIDNLQPRVTISMTIKKAGATTPEIKIQTSISQRNLDILQ